MGNSNGFNGFGLGGGSGLKPVRIRSQGHRTQLSQEEFFYLLLILGNGLWKAL